MRETSLVPGFKGKKDKKYIVWTTGEILILGDIREFLLLFIGCDEWQFCGFIR